MISNRYKALMPLCMSLLLGPWAGFFAMAEEAPAAEDTAENLPQSAQSSSGVLQLDQTVISGNQELPKVLYILPWREPEGLPDIEIQAEFTEEEVFRRLYPPAYRRELGYFETLSGLKESPNQEK